MHLFINQSYVSWHNSCQKVPNITNTFPVKDTPPKSHKLHKNGENRGDFSKLFSPTSVTKWELQNIGLFLTRIPLMNVLLHFHGCSSSANICLFAISNTGLSFFPMRNVWWNLVVTKTVGFILGSTLFNKKYQPELCIVYSQYYLFMAWKEPNGDC